MTEPPTDARTFAASVGVVAAAAVYLITTAGRVGVVYYLPIEHRWTLDPERADISMDWFWRAAVTLVVGAVGTWLAPRLAPRDPLLRARATRTLFGLGLAALAWALAFTVMMLVGARN